MAKAQPAGPTAIDAAEQQVEVWDLFVRVFHWTVAIGFFVAYFTEDGPITLHVWAGYLVGALVVLRPESCSAICAIWSRSAAGPTSATARRAAPWSSRC